MWVEHESGLLDTAVHTAVEEGRREVSNLEAIAETVGERYRSLASHLAQAHGAADSARELERHGSAFAARLTSHLAEQREVLATFNIAFFGRTGAGKSTLLSAFGQLDGSAVSTGESDFTTKVRSIEWRGCRLYDTPGINGWGRTVARVDLEARARKAIEIADVVLLCFDSQSQQASEFSKVAQWVQHYGKPVIAALNNRNLRWRDPVRLQDPVKRRNVSETVRQHAESIRSELANIGLEGTPVVAIQARRALFARASTPFMGPAHADFLHERAIYGEELIRWSNFGVLEELIVACITEGGAQLRLNSLREGTRSILRDEVGTLGDRSAQMSGEIDELERAAAQLLEVLGYIEVDERATYLWDDAVSGDLLSILECARGELFRSPSDGSFHRYVRNLLKAHLSTARQRSLDRLDDLDFAAFNQREDITSERFVETIFDEDEINSAAQTVWSRADEFLQREISLAMADVPPDISGVERDSAEIGGAAGESMRFAGNAMRGGSVAGGVASALALFAAANFWNPSGWVGGIAIAGIGLVAHVNGLLGERAGREAERQRRDARSQAITAGRTAINATFDRIEEWLAESCRVDAWTRGAAKMRDVVRRAVALRTLRQDLNAFTGTVRAEAEKIATTAPTSRIVQAAERFVVSQHHPEGFVGDRRVSDLVFLGEDWIDSGVTGQADRRLSPAAHDLCAQIAARDTAELRDALTRGLTTPGVDPVRDWHSELAVEAQRDAALGAVVAECDAACPSMPVVAVLGDYSSGKSSLIKRLIVEFGGSVPETLHVRADPTTDRVHTFDLPDFQILDTPGFQSGRAGHDARALSVLSGAALVIVVVHVNLLLGDTKLLAEVANGTPSHVGKQPRILFLINRCDELGVDPVNATEEYFLRRSRKELELEAALASRQIFAAGAQIHGVAGDPFASIGARRDVTREDYAEHAAWDGIGPLIAALTSMTSADWQAAHGLACFDIATSRLMKQAGLLQDDIDELKVDVETHESLLLALQNCEQEADLCAKSLEQQLKEAIAPHADTARADARNVARGHFDQLSDIVNGWWDSQGVRDAVGQFQINAAKQVDKWYTTNESAIRREFAATDFSAQFDDLRLPDSEPAADTATRIAGHVADRAADLAGALGNRDAAYWIGKNVLNVKFKPWGAVKAGAKVAKAGAVLQVAAAALEAWNWHRDSEKKGEWELAVDDACHFIVRQMREHCDALLHAPDERGPLSYLAARMSDLAALKTVHEEARADAGRRIDTMNNRLAAVDRLIAASEQLRSGRGHIDDTF